MSKKGDCFDNAVVESFVASLKPEECDGAAYPTLDIARQHVFAYLKQFYNCKRRHSSVPDILGLRASQRKKSEEGLSARCTGKKGSVLGV